MLLRLIAGTNKMILNEETSTKSAQKTTTQNLNIFPDSREQCRAQNNFLISKLCWTQNYAFWWHDKTSKFSSLSTTHRYTSTSWLYSRMSINWRLPCPPSSPSRRIPSHSPNRHRSPSTCRRTPWSSCSNHVPLSTDTCRVRIYACQWWIVLMGRGGWPRIWRWSVVAWRISWASTSCPRVLSSIAIRL